VRARLTHGRHKWQSSQPFLRVVLYPHVELPDRSAAIESLPARQEGISEPEDD
jgi:hypothetical protein